MRLRTEHGQKQKPVRQLIDEAEIDRGPKTEDDLGAQPQIERLSEESNEASADQALDDAGARQQALEADPDLSHTLGQLEKRHSIERDDPDSLIDQLDPVPPEGG